jgi:hypothetical protein
MALIELKAADVTPPIEGKVRVIAVTTTSQAVDIQEFLNDYMTAHAEDGDVYYVFGTSASVTASATATSGNTRAMRLPKDQDRDWLIEKRSGITHVALVTKTGTANFRYAPS